MAPAPVNPPSPVDISSAAAAIGFLRDWWVQLAGTGVFASLAGLALRGSWQASAWKRGVEEKQRAHSEQIAALQQQAREAAEKHDQVALAVHELPRRDEVRDMIGELGESQRAALAEIRADLRALIAPMAHADR